MRSGVFVPPCDHKSAAAALIIKVLYIYALYSFKTILLINVV